MSGKKFKNTAELLERSSQYIKRTKALRDNYEEALSKEEVDKAAEMLWGIFSCHVNALAVLRNGEPYTEFGKMVEFTEDLAKEKEDKKLGQAVKSAKKAHANFYHGFWNDKEDLIEVYLDVIYAITVIQQEIDAAQARIVIS